MSVDPSGISTIGAAGVATVGTLAVTGAALKAVDRTSRRMTGGGGGRVMKKSGKNYNIWAGSKKSHKGSKLLRF